MTIIADRPTAGLEHRCPCGRTFEDCHDCPPKGTLPRLPACQDGTDSDPDMDEALRRVRPPRRASHFGLVLGVLAVVSAMACMSAGSGASIAEQQAADAAAQARIQAAQAAAAAAERARQEAERLQQQR